MDTPPETPEEKDKNAEDLPPKVDAPADDNTKSGAPVTVVMSKLEAELAAERARVEAELAFARTDRQKMTTKKIVIIVVVVVVALAIFGLLFFFLAQSITGQYRPSNSNSDKEDPSQGVVLPTVEGYKCTTEKCSKVADLTTDEILVRDNAYYVYNRDTDRSMKTTIDSIDFRSFTPFRWGDALLLVLERETGRQGLYSISSNRPLTNSYNYSDFNRDINSEAYQGMQWIVGAYIFASAPPETRLIDIRDGQELVRAPGRIYVDPDFIIGYEAEGQRRGYTMSGSRIVVADAPTALGIYDHHLIHVTAAKSFEVYDNSGAKLQNSDEYYRSLRERFRATDKDYADALSDIGAFVVAN